MKSKFHLPAIAVLVCTMFTATGVFAATCTTTSAGNWSDPSIWSCGNVPNTGDDVRISNNVTVDANSNAVNSLTVNSGATLSFTQGAKIHMLNANSLFRVMGGATINGGNPGSKITYPSPGNSISGPFNQAGPATSNGSGSFTAGVTLPLTLLYFNAARQEAKVTTEWQTANEKNIAAFVVERSNDGKVFTPVSNTITPVNTASAHYYSWTDAQPATGNSFYRIRISELDGTSNLSGIAMVNNRAGNIAALFPNPAQNKINIGFSALQAASVVSVMITDITGREIFRSSGNGALLQVDISAWHTGVYMARVVVDGEITVYRFMKS
jgi:hypothetical protein